jgi:tRNA A58 N-methylase Trm61
VPRGVAFRRLPFGLGRGLTMEVDFDRDARYWLGLYEIELARHIRALCEPGSACFDLGSASGFYALVFAQRGAGRVLAVEADLETCERLRRNVAANPELAPRIDVSESRIAHDAGDGAVSIDELAFRPGGFVPDLVKMDVEGNEAAALRGAERLLSERKPHVIVETHSEDLDAGCRWLLEDQGYAVESVEPRRFAPEVRTLGFNRWCVARGDPRRR